MSLRGLHMDQVAPLTENKAHSERLASDLSCVAHVVVAAYERWHKSALAHSLYAAGSSCTSAQIMAACMSGALCKSS